MAEGETPEIILAVNAGSSTVKLDLFTVGEADIERTGHRTLEIANASAEDLRGFVGTAAAPPGAVVHRIVHGGRDLTGPSVAEGKAVAAIERATPLAPLHNPRGREWLGIAREAMPDATQIVVPDTGFFADLPPEASRYALPRAFSDELGIRRYGFHGIAHQSMLRSWASELQRGGLGTRVITIQLGSGCSVAACRDGIPIDTSMGFTPLEGLVMATRSGDVDPGIIIHLMRERGMSADDLDRLLNKESGLLGLAGSGDMRELFAADTTEADEAIEIFCYRVAKYLGAYLGALGGVDAILFGGGIGEHSAAIRARILSRFAWAGIRFDSTANRAADEQPGAFHDRDSTAELHVIAVDEAAEMVRLALPLFG